jgi:hypothetical protein
MPEEEMPPRHVTQSKVRQWWVEVRKLRWWESSKSEGRILAAVRVLERLEFARRVEDAQRIASSPNSFHAGYVHPRPSFKRR